MTTTVDVFSAAHMPLPSNLFESAQSSALTALKSPAGRKLSKAAGEFEAILLESLWKSMKDTFKSESDADSDPTLDGYGDLGIQGLASAVGKSGGLGIKSMILKHLGPILTVGNQGIAAP